MSMPGTSMLRGSDVSSATSNCIRNTKHSDEVTNIIIIFIIMHLQCAIIQYEDNVVLVGGVAQWKNVGFWPADFPRPAPDLQLTGITMGKPSVGQLIISTQPSILSGSISCNQMAAITRQWWRRLVNAYEVKAGIVCLQCKRCVIHTWALQKICISLEALYNGIPLALHVSKNNKR